MSTRDRATTQANGQSSAMARLEPTPDARLEASDRIRFDNVSRFYGDVLGVNRVTLEIGPGITSLVGPNGAGKSTLMNLMTGLIRPTAGRISVLGLSPSDPVRLFHQVGYCTQYDAFPPGLTGYRFVRSFLEMHGYSEEETEALTREAIEAVSLTEASSRKVAGYSKGMKQRIKLARAISHHPRVLLLDEPLNGLDPMARAEVIDLFKGWAARGCYVIISSHILHEVDLISDRVVLINSGYVVAEGEIAGVRSEIKAQPLQIAIRCDEPGRLGARLLEAGLVNEVKLQGDRSGLVVRTGDAEVFYRAFSSLVVQERFRIEGIEPIDDNVQAAYDYLIVREG